ncbi:DUF937 domain-containing protein [Rhodococcus sovatensis]|uniref:DUF937 domain-containing protein n=1 Tax=Rhodococcus sovatensis TaxID=1805840 RepID=A0ABZ2PGH8_9NOCA
MASLDELLAQIPIGQIASKLGVDEETARSAVTRALPTLVGGLEANAQDPAGAASLENALQQHSSSSLLDGGIDIDQVDEADGEKIVSNVFGDKKTDVASALGGISGGADSGLVAKVLPILAPIVLAYLAKRFTGGGQEAGAQASGGGLGDLLGSVLGSGGSGGSGGLGGVLGGILGGGSGGSGGGLGDLLGGLLGGGKK